MKFSHVFTSALSAIFLLTSTNIHAQDAISTAVQAHDAIGSAAMQGPNGAMMGLNAASQAIKNGPATNPPAPSLAAPGTIVVTPGSTVVTGTDGSQIVDYGNTKVTKNVDGSTVIQSPSGTTIVKP